MPSENLNELHAFVVVASAGSFTQAAKRLGVSPSGWGIKPHFIPTPTALSKYPPSKSNTSFTFGGVANGHDAVFNINRMPQVS